MKKTTMTILIIGATGMLGQALIREGISRAVKPIGIARSNADHDVDITDTNQLTHILAKIRPEVVINAAAMTNLFACEKDNYSAYLVNARAVAILAEACAKIRIKLIQISTDHYYINDRNSKHHESASIHLVNEYARTKYAGEAFALACPESLVIRTNIVGFRGKKQPTFIEWAIASLQAGKKMTLFEDFYASSIHVNGCASAIYDLLPKNISGVLNLASRQVCSKKEFILLLAKKLGIEPINMLPGSVLKMLDVRRAESLGLDVSRAERYLGYDLPTTQEVVDSLVCEHRRMVI